MATPEEEAAAAGKNTGGIPPVEPKPVVLKPGEVIVSQDLLQKTLESVAELERQREEDKGRMAGIEALMAADGKDDSPTGEKGLRMRKNYEPAFRTVRIRQYPIAGDFENLGYVVGWSNRGAYSKVVDTGVQKEKVDYIDIMFLDPETGEARRSAEGVLQAEAVPLLSFLNDGVQKHCKIVSVDKNDRLEPTGEEIKVVEFDPAHGMMETGETIDGYVGFTDRTFTIQIAGIAKNVVVDEKYCN